MPAKIDLQSRCLHGGQPADPAHGALQTPIYQTTSFRRLVLGEEQPYTYSRVENPTVAALEARLGDLEDALPAVAFSSGLAAVTTLLLTVLRAGDHVVCSDVVYGGTYRTLTEILSGLGVGSAFVDTADPEAVERALRPTTRLLIVESPANPTLKLADIAGCAAKARARGALVAVDNTFLTPVLQRPLELGADLTLYSTTKAIDGHNAAVGGAITTRDADLRERLVHLRKCLGTIQTPHNAWLTLQGLKTLPLRLGRQTASALKVATALNRLPGVLSAVHPDLPEFPQSGLVRRQQSGGGGLVAVTLVGGLAVAAATLQNLRLCTPAENLGAVETLVTHCASLTHAAIPAERRRRLGIHDGLLRVSVGLEDPEHIVADLVQAIVAATPEVRHA